MQFTNKVNVKEETGTSKKEILLNGKRLLTTVPLHPWGPTDPVCPIPPCRSGETRRKKDLTWFCQENTIFELQGHKKDLQMTLISPNFSGGIK